MKNPALSLHALKEIQSISRSSSNSASTESLAVILLVSNRRQASLTASDPFISWTGVNVAESSCKSAAKSL